MKIRIRGNTIRFRLTKPEVETFCSTGFLEAKIDFYPEPFSYSIQTDESLWELKAVFLNGRLTLLVPAAWIKDWVISNRTGFESSMVTGQGVHIDLLLEKDFKCLDQTVGDQSDQYENPLNVKS